MSNERRFGDDEVREIFDRASRSGAVRLGGGSIDEHGLTLPELQDVGKEVGLDPERIAEAAAALDHPAVPVPVRR